MAESVNINEAIYGYPIGEANAPPDVLDQLGCSEGSSVEIINKWYKGGNESYIFRFSVKDGATGEAADFIAKACVKLQPTLAMNEWLERRKVVEQAGINTPRLFTASQGTLIEEYIPLTFKEAHAQADKDTRLSMEADFIKLFVKLRELGFSPASFHDLRSRGADLVMIDFGEDLGPVTKPDLRTERSVADAERMLKNIIT